MQYQVPTDFKLACGEAHIGLLLLECWFVSWDNCLQNYSLPQLRNNVKLCGLYITKCYIIKYGLDLNWVLLCI